VSECTQTCGPPGKNLRAEPLPVPQHDGGQTLCSAVGGSTVKSKVRLNWLFPEKPSLGAQLFVEGLSSLLVFLELWYLTSSILHHLVRWDNFPFKSEAGSVWWQNWSNLENHNVLNTYQVVPLFWLLPLPPSLSFYNTAYLGGLSILDLPSTSLRLNFPRAETAKGRTENIIISMLSNIY
jgi:hypothetical protein